MNWQIMSFTNNPNGYRISEQVNLVALLSATHKTDYEKTYLWNLKNVLSYVMPGIFGHDFSVCRNFLHMVFFHRALVAEWTSVVECQ